MKRIFKVILSFFLLLGCFDFGFVKKINATVYDTEPPTLISVYIDKTEVIAGDVINFTLNATDDISGMKRVSIGLHSPITDKTVVVSFSKIEDGVFKGELVTNDKFEDGIWKVYYACLTDNNNNNIYYYNSVLHPSNKNLYDFSHCDFTFSGGSNADVTKPSFIDINIDNNRLSVGDKIKFSIEANDDRSGVDSCYVYLRSPITNKTIYVICNNYENGYFSGTLTMDDTYENGVWKIAYIAIFDKENNIKNIRNSNLYTYSADELVDLSDCDFEFIGAQHTDLLPPELHGITVDKNL